MARDTDESMVVRIRRTYLLPTDEQSVLLRPNEQVVGVQPHYEPDGIHLDVFIAQALVSGSSGGA